MLRESVLGHRRPADQMLLNDFLQHLGTAGVVPNTFRVDHCDRAVSADLQAISLGSVNTTITYQTQLQQPALEESPGFEAEIVFATFRFALIAAQEDVPLY